MIRKIRRYLGFTRRGSELLRESFLDSLHYLMASAIGRGIFKNEQGCLESDIIRLYHVVEKSLSMPEFRPKAAADAVKGLHVSLKKWKESATPHILAGWEVLKAYQDRHESIGVDISDILDETLIPDLKVEQGTTSEGGVKRYCLPVASKCEAFLEIMTGRVSVRNFDTERLPEREVLERAVQHAMSAPSVCNRQTWKAHCFYGKDAQEVLALQNGNRGFGHTIPVVFVLTSDLRLFTGVTERYQGWVDGGIFAMSLLLALHAERLGAVALNWSVLNKRDRELKRLTGIPRHERVITLVGCGIPADGAVVPVSTRRAVSEVFVEHGGKQGG